ncbi:YciI family protein, partial [Micromonospora sp. KC721]|uniref:YciI family protein n=1 Tax=Micromonospora sp. KC721 TaxID=2530380 RepID=UPI001FB58CE5
GSDREPTPSDRARDEKELPMKYMIMMFSGMGASLVDRSPEWITEIQTTMMRMDRELRQAGEVIESRHLTDPTQATTVRFVDGAPAPTDGPFAEIKESLAGYWVIEGSYERAVEIASQVVAVTEFPMEVRRIMDEPPTDM